MAGNRSAENGDYITPRASYRELITADVGGPTDAGIPVLDTRSRGVASLDLGTPSFYGRNAQINLAAIMEGVTAATIQLWLLAEIEEKEPVQETSSSSSSAGPSNEWVKIGADTSLTGSALVVYKDLPPGQYKAVVTSLSGSGTLFLREQHAA